MAQPSIVLDGSMPYGSRVLTINAVAYKANNIQISRPFTEAEDQGITGVPGRRRATLNRAELSAELQLATSATAFPIFGQTFTDTFDASVGAETFVLDPVPYDETNDPSQIRTVKITAKSVVNSITTV